jgi:hypothetical protein
MANYLCISPSSTNIEVDTISECLAHDVGGYITPSVSNYQSYLSLLQDGVLEAIGINTADIFYVFSWGFGSVVFFWFLGYQIAIAQKAINKV